MYMGISHRKHKNNTWGEWCNKFCHIESCVAFLTCSETDKNLNFNYSLVLDHSLLNQGNYYNISLFKLA